jgi:hypothetical protein
MDAQNKTPDYAALHPGYVSTSLSHIRNAYKSISLRPLRLCGEKISVSSMATKMLA